MAETPSIPSIGLISPAYASLRRLTEPPLFRLPGEYSALPGSDAPPAPSSGLLAGLEGAGRNRQAALLAQVPSWLQPLKTAGAEEGAEDAEKGLAHPALAVPAEGRFALEAPEVQIGL